MTDYFSKDYEGVEGYKDEDNTFVMTYRNQSYSFPSFLQALCIGSIGINIENLKIGDV